MLPQVAPDSWTLRIDGMVSSPLEITFGELLRMPLTEADITLVCVSNEVGGVFTRATPGGSAPRWPPCSAGPAGAAGADQVLSAAADGMTISTPLATILDSRNAPLAVGMNGGRCLSSTGSPPGCWCPACTATCRRPNGSPGSTVTTFARQRAYWTQRGYAERAPIKTESRIDVPRPLAPGAGLGHRSPESPGRRPAASRPSRSALTGALPRRQALGRGRR